MSVRTTKKLLLLLSLIVLGRMASAQELGIRFGDVLGNSVAVDGLFQVCKFSRVHADLSFGNSGVGIEALYDLLYRPIGGEAFNWYVGAGPSMRIDALFFPGLSGEIGLGYHFSPTPFRSAWTGAPPSGSSRKRTSAQAVSA